MNGQLFGLTGRVACVTGAAAGIGRATALRLAALGAHVVATDINEAGLADLRPQLGDAAMALPLDVADEGSWQTTGAAIEKQFGRLDILVNNAGLMIARPFLHADIHVLRRQLSVNVEGVYLGMQMAVPLMQSAIAQGAGANGASIINLSSIYGKVAGDQFAAYSASKGAVRALSKAVAVELAASRIRVNCVLPGPVQDTDLAATWDPPVDSKGEPLSGEDAKALWTAKIPMGRHGDPGEIAALIAFLASDAAAFTTGSEYVADGGYTAA